MRTVDRPEPAQATREMPMALQLCWKLVDIPSREKYLHEASAALARAFDADLALWFECGIRDQAWTVVDVECAQRSPATVARALTAAGRDHPGVASYLLDPLDLAPRRVREAIARVRPRYPGSIAPHQLLGIDHAMSMLVALTPDSARCWVVMRSARDFSCEQLAAAADVQALLTALDRLHPSPHYPPRRHSGPSPLTQRETDVLREVATGHTATAIGRRLGISPGTVRKHLERAYAKLNCHDRLIAVEKARALGLVPASSQDTASLGRSRSAPPAVAALH